MNIALVEMEMPAVESFGEILQIKNKKAPSLEYFILEAHLFMEVFQNLKNHFGLQYKNYFQLLKLSTEMENKMIEEKFLKYLIEDILVTQQYTIEGIAYYANTTEDVIFDIIAGYNTAPSLLLASKIISLHKTVRPGIYRIMQQKITEPTEEKMI